MRRPTAISTAFLTTALLLAAVPWARAAAQDAGPPPPPVASPQAAAPAGGTAAEPTADAALDAAAAGDATEAGPAVAAPAAPAEPAEQDAAADFFLSRCAGCHTVGGGTLTGPDLEPATGWPPADLAKAIERMEKNVGPMSDERVASLVELLEDEELAARLSAARERQVEAMAATLEPASPRRGEALFHGAARFARGGLPCAACHRAGSSGGSLAADLTGAAGRLGEPALLSAAETPGFPLMRAAYRDHPVSRQEAIHVVAYLAGLAPPEGTSTDTAAGTAGSAGPPIGAWGAALALAFLAAMAVVYRGRNRGVRAPLVRAAGRR